MKNFTKTILASFVLLFVLSNLGWGQTNPTAQTIPYMQNFGTSTFTSMPTGWASWNGLNGGSITTLLLAENSSPTGNATITGITTITTGGGTFGYAVSSNARPYIQTSSNATNGVNQLILALNTTGYTNVLISYDVEIISAQPRTVGIVMQYRIGTSGAWTTITGTGNPYSQAGGTAGIKVSPSLTLPEACNNQSVVQIRWAIWRGTESGSSSGIAIDNISASGNSLSTPSIICGSISGFGNQIVNTYSTEKSYTVSGTNLTSDIVIKPPTGFEISLSNSPFTPVDSIKLSPSSGTVSSTNIYVRFAPTIVQSYSDNITHTSSGATSVNVPVTGNALNTEPTSQSNNITFSEVQPTQFTINWSSGDGSNRIILMKSGSAVNSDPVDGTSYISNSIFGSGSQIGTGNYVVYSGNGSSTTVTGLNGSTSYYIAIYEFNGTSGSENYFTNSPATGNQTTLAAPQGLQITSLNTLFTIDFDNTVSGVNNGKFTGSGFQPSPSAGQMSSNAWSITGWSDGNLSFGGTQSSGDYSRGISTGGVTTGGIYSFTVSTNNSAFGFQPGSSDWNPGTITLKLQNNSGSTVNKIMLSYKVYINNDQGRSSNFNFSYSADNLSYTNDSNVDLASTAASSGSTNWLCYLRTIQINDLSIANGDFYYLRWSGADVSGTGSRDEFALDDIQIIANQTTQTPTIQGAIESAIINCNTTLSDITTISNSLIINSDALLIGSNTLNINGTVSGSGTITGTSSSNLVIGGTGDLGTIYFTSGSEVLGNLTMNRTLTGTVVIGNSLSVTNTLTLTNGVIYMGNNIMTLGTSTSSLGTLVFPNISDNSSYILGNFERWIPASVTDSVFYPVGDTNSYRPAVILYTSAPSGGKLMVNGHGDSPGTLNTSDSLTDGSYVLDRYSLEAWWKFTSTGLSGGTYNLTLGGYAINGVSLSNFTKLRLIKRANNSSKWRIVGNHNDAGGTNSKPLVNRTDIIDGFSEFGIGGFSGDGNILNNAPLPVHLASFTSSANKRIITLNWSTSSEANNSGFDVERKGMNESNWMKAGYVQGSGNSNSTKNYSFTDRGLQTGKYQYRLKQIDFNGNYEYFDLNGYVEVGVPNKYDISQNYPNPFNPVTKIDYDLPFDSKVSLRIYDVTGREVKNLFSGDMKAGYYTQVFDASSLSSGVYFYRVVMKSGKADFVQSKKMVVLK